jgi:hypothetical protein
VAVPIRDGVDLVAIGSKERAPKAWSMARSASGPPVRGRGARLGLLVKW